jgi:hypothetical protein
MRALREGGGEGREGSWTGDGQQTVVRGRSVDHLSLVLTYCLPVPFSPLISAPLPPSSCWEDDTQRTAASVVAHHELLVTIAGDSVTLRFICHTTAVLYLTADKIEQILAKSFFCVQLQTCGLI